MILKQIIREEVRRALSAHSNKGRKVLNSLYAARVNESYGADFTGPGLIVKGRTPIDNNTIKDIVEDYQFIAYWNARAGYWFFPEEPETLDALEDELSATFDTFGLNVSFETQEQ